MSRHCAIPRLQAEGWHRMQHTVHPDRIDPDYQHLLQEALIFCLLNIHESMDEEQSQSVILPHNLEGSKIISRHVTT